MYVTTLLVLLIIKLTKKSLFSTPYYKAQTLNMIEEVIGSTKEKWLTSGTAGKIWVPTFVSGTVHTTEGFGHVTKVLVLITPVTSLTFIHWRNIVALANMAPLSSKKAPPIGAPDIRAYSELFVKIWLKNLNK